MPDILGVQNDRVQVLVDRLKPAVKPHLQATAQAQLCYAAIVFLDWLVQEVDIELKKDALRGPAA